MSEAAVTVRVRKFMRNPLLKRRQMVDLVFFGIYGQTVEVIHPKRASVSKEDIKNLLCKKYNVADDKTVILFGFQIAFGNLLSRPR